MLELEFKELKKSHIIPNAITYSNMLLGTIAIFISIISRNNIKFAAVLILIAGIMDKLDGYVARKLDLTSKFGKELDSLCDLVSFGIAPMVLWWTMNRSGLGVMAGLASVLFIGSGIFRLARYNITKDEEYIIGLPITIAGMIMAGKCFMDISYRLEKIHSNALIFENIILISILSIMMISNFKIKKIL